MLQDSKRITGRIIQASDGDVGQVTDFLFDDTSWSLRYLVVETGPWLNGRRILLAPESFERNAFYISDPLPTKLTREQIGNSPLFDNHQKISRDYEENYYDHHGWSGYWNRSNPEDTAISAMVSPAQMREIAPDRPHLHSVNSISGFHLHAKDGNIGKVSSVSIETRKWKVAEIVVETGHWYSGKQILILTETIERISYDNSAIYVDLSLDDIRTTPADNVAQAESASR